MEKSKNIIATLINNWKVILFAVVYVFCFFMVVALSFDITEYVKGSDYPIFSPLLLCVALLSILSLITKSILYIVFKDETNKVAMESSIVLIPVGIFVAISAVFSLVSNIPFPIDNTSELGRIISIFAVPAYFIFLIMIGMFLLG